MKDCNKKKSTGSNIPESKTSKPNKQEEEFPLVDANAFAKELGEMVGRFLAVEDTKTEPSH